MPYTIHNPIVPGWYADPEARSYEGEYWIYVTRSFTRYEDQMNLDAFHSADLVHWEKCEGIIDMSGFPHIWRAVWAPTIIEKGGRYYLIFASNDIQSDEAEGGLEIAVSDSPAGPFRAYLGHPLIDRFIHGAQPIDAHLFRDDDGTVWLYYGGWGHCNLAKMNEDMTGFVPFPDGEIFHEITPPGYVEGPCMLKADGKYHLMWSTGCWEDGSYSVQYCTAGRPDGPFEKGITILSTQEPVANGPGHHGYLWFEPTKEWLIVYHRRIIGDPEPGHRVLCIDRLPVEGGQILPVRMTDQWSDEA